MTQITLPNQNVTGANLWSQVEDNDQAIVDVVNGDIGSDNLADDAVTAAKLRDDASTDANRAVTTNHIRDGAVTTAKVGNAQITAPKLGLSITSATNNSDVISSGNTEQSAIATGSLPAGTYLVLFSGAVKVNESVATCYVRVKAGSTTLQTINPITSGSNTALEARLPIAVCATTTTANAGTFSVTIQAPTTGFGSAISAGGILTVIRIG